MGPSARGESRRRPDTTPPVPAARTRSRRSRRKRRRYAGGAARAPPGASRPSSTGLATFSQVKPLPPPSLRWGPPRLNEDAAFVESAVDLATDVTRLVHLRPESELLDLGCGPGRL